MAIQLISPKRLFYRLFIASFLIWAIGSCESSSRQHVAADNKATITKAFENWAQGQGSIFDLLADNASWTVASNSTVSKTYTSKKQFIDEVILPFNEKLSQKLIPVVRGIYADGDMVIALWDGTAIAKDGKPYSNTYSWYMRMKDGKIIDVVAFFDTIAFNDLWNRL